MVGAERNHLLVVSLSPSRTCCLPWPLSHCACHLSTVTRSPALPTTHTPVTFRHSAFNLSLVTSLSAVVRPLPVEALLPHHHYYFQSPPSCFLLTFSTTTTT